MYTIVTLPPTPENIDACRLLIADRDLGVRIEQDSRQRGVRRHKRVYRLADGRYFVNRHLGHWRQFVTGVKVMMRNGQPDMWLGVVLGDTEMKRK